jgi:hypothetical protein
MWKLKRQPRGIVFFVPILNSIHVFRSASSMFMMHVMLC